MIYRDTDIAAAARSAFNRRSGGRGGFRRGGGGAPAQAVGIEGFLSAINWMTTAVGQLMPGAAAGYWVALLMRVLSTPSGVMYPASCVSAVNGWFYEMSGTATFHFVSTNGAAARVNSPDSAITAADVGEIVSMVGVHDGTANLVRLYRAGVQVGAGTAIVGYTAPSAAGRCAWGALAAGGSATPWARYVGLSYGTGIPSDADILAHYAACKAERGMALMPGAGVDVNRWRASGNNPAGVSWPDDIAGMVYTKTGTLTAVTFPPVFEP